MPDRESVKLASSQASSPESGEIPLGTWVRSAATGGLLVTNMWSLSSLLHTQYSKIWTFKNVGEKNKTHYQS